MKKILLFVFVIALFFSCKKEKQYNLDEHITYTHWYKTRASSTDTLFSVYKPNAFTPNGDGVNDVFYPKGNFILKSFKIFNRENNLIFETTDINGHWDGRASQNGDNVQMGIYIYKLNISDRAGNQYEYEGSVTLFT